MTLLEILLAMAIASSLIMMGYRHYQSLRKDAVGQQVMTNVDHLFEAAADYYQANCRIKIDPETGLTSGTTGTLDPSYNPAPTNPYALTLSYLQTSGFLTVPLPTVGIVNNAGVSNGYVVQFNRTTPNPDRTMTDYTGATAKLGQIIVWRVQVAVEFTTTADAQVYKNLLAADCVSTLNSGNTTVYPCSVGASAGGKYVVWERLPSFASPGSSSDLWMSNAGLKRFNEMYTAFPVLYLSSAPAGGYPLQNYMCGG